MAWVYDRLKQTDFRMFLIPKTLKHVTKAKSSADNQRIKRQTFTQSIYEKVSALSYISTDEFSTDWLGQSRSYNSSNKARGLEAKKNETPDEPFSIIAAHNARLRKVVPNCLKIYILT